MPELRRFRTDAWELEVPGGISGRAFEPPPDSPYDSTFILRGRLHDSAPARRIDGTIERVIRSFGLLDA